MRMAFICSPLIALIFIAKSSSKAPRPEIPKLAGSILYAFASTII